MSLDCGVVITARAACLFWARHFVLCVGLGEIEVSDCRPGENPQTSAGLRSASALRRLSKIKEEHFMFPISGRCLTELLHTSIQLRWEALGCAVKMPMDKLLELLVN